MAPRRASIPDPNFADGAVGGPRGCARPIMGGADPSAHPIPARGESPRSIADSRAGRLPRPVVAEANRGVAGYARGRPAFGRRPAHVPHRPGGAVGSPPTVFRRGGHPNRGRSNESVHSAAVGSESPGSTFSFFGSGHPAAPAWRGGAATVDHDPPGVRAIRGLRPRRRLRGGESGPLPGPWRLRAVARRGRPATSTAPFHRGRGLRVADDRILHVPFRGESRGWATPSRGAGGPWPPLGVAGPRRLTAAFREPGDPRSPPCGGGFVVANRNRFRAAASSGGCPPAGAGDFHGAVRGRGFRVAGGPGLSVHSVPVRGESHGPAAASSGAGDPGTRSAAVFPIRRPGHRAESRVKRASVPASPTANESPGPKRASRVPGPPDTGARGNSPPGSMRSGSVFSLFR